jgi:hypothetical protein
MSPEDLAKVRAHEDAALARGERLHFICEFCLRDFMSSTRERFCSSRCRKRAKTSDAEKAFTLPPVIAEEDLDPMEPVWDPRAGRYRTTSWAKWA